MISIKNHYTLERKGISLIKCLPVQVLNIILQKNLTDK